MASLLSLFDGSGCWPLAAELVGITPKYASEIEKFPIQVTTKNFPNMIHLGDVREVHGDSAEYKMWGNGMALPCALYVMEGVKDYLERNNFDAEEV